MVGVEAHHDEGYLRFRRNSVRIASATSLAGVTMIAVYAATSWRERPHPAWLIGLAGLIALAMAVIELGNAARLVETRWCDLFFGAWSASYVAIIVAFALLDGGADSPLNILFFPVLVFAGLCYPLRLAVFIGVGCVVGYLGVALGTSAHDLDEPLFVAGCLGLTAVMCAWQAQTVERQRRELSAASRSDHLTGSLNRRGFYEHAERVLARARRAPEPVALVLIDLDSFKAVNDRHGHAAGDRLLCWVVDSLRGALRPGDAIARLGGDEFALLLPGIEADGARVIAERMRIALRARASVSLGVAAFPQRDSAEGLLADADDELYRDKSRGRGTPQRAPIRIQVPDGFWA